MKKIIVEFSNERLITPSGLSLVGGALGKSNIWIPVFMDLHHQLVLT